MFAKKDTDVSVDVKKPSRFDRALKWVTALTAVISLFFAVQKVTQTIAENTERAQQLSEIIRVAAMQQQAMDYSRAWDSLATASKLAESGDAFAKLLGQHDVAIAKVQIQREDLAMAWLMNISVPEGQRFSDMVNKLAPVFEQGTNTTSPQRRADLLAHIGWSYFLRNRDGNSNFDPAQHYFQAIGLDAQNPYANAYWAHWILWQRGNIDTARNHFTQALQSNRAIERVRNMQLIAFHNLGSDGDALYLSTIVEMIKNQESIPANFRIEAKRMFDNACSKYGEALLKALKEQMASADLAQTYRDLSARDTANEQAENAACVAKLQ